jgi:hypothetical protein
MDPCRYLGWNLRLHNLDKPSIAERYLPIFCNRLDASECSLEVDFSARFKTKVAESVNGAEWDILLFSVHEFENAKDIERAVERTSIYAPYSPWARLSQIRDACA